MKESKTFPIVNNHLLYTDSEITFRDVIYAQELLDRVELMAQKIKESPKETKVSKEQVDSDLTEAVKKLLKD